MNAQHQLVLASESPRRKTLLAEAGYSFETFPVKVSESLEKNLSVDLQITHLAIKKAEAAFASYKLLKLHDFLILSADTMVCKGDQVLGKPKDQQEACQFLRQLSAGPHSVKTAFCFIEGLVEQGKIYRGKTLTGICTTEVYFRNLTDEEIQAYVATGEPMDKAGAYGIQGKARAFVEKIIGPYDNVVGLPRDLIMESLAKNGLQIARSLELTLSQIKQYKSAGIARIVAISKLQDAEKIRLSYAQGQRLFGENYVQEALLKMSELKDLTDIEWHFVGRLQKNKVKNVVGQFKLIHSVDSIELAESINRAAEQKETRQEILLQMNLANEATKGGFTEQELPLSIPKLKELKNISIKGWMAMPPLADWPELSRHYFVKLRNLRDQYLSLLPEALELSMGTSSDYTIALGEGATLVRLGTTIFGPRPYNK